MVAGTVRYSTMIPVPVATLYPLKYRRRYFCELELDPGAGAVDTAFKKHKLLYRKTDGVWVVEAQSKSATDGGKLDCTLKNCEPPPE